MRILVSFLLFYLIDLSSFPPPLYFAGLITIIGLDLMFSGDNAVAIGTAVHRTRERARWVVYAGGIALAILCRVGLAWGAGYLSGIPYLQTASALLLIGIAVRFIAFNGSANGDKGSPSGSLGILSAVISVAWTDATLSLDNAVVIGALSRGDLLLLSVGLFISIILMMVASAVIAWLLDRLPWLQYIAAILIAGAAGDVLINDIPGKALIQMLSFVPSAVIPWIVRAGCILLALVGCILVRRWRKLRHHRKLAQLL